MARSKVKLVGVSRAILALFAIVLVIVVAGAATYISTAGAPKSTRSASSTTSLQSSSSQATSSSSSSTTSSTSTISTTFTSSSSGTTSQTTTCSSNTTATYSTLGFGPLLGNFSSMSTSFTLTSSQSSSLNATSTYTVVSSSAKGFELSIQANFNGTATNAEAWVLRNGTVTTFEYMGGLFGETLLTGISASTSFSEVMLPFSYETEYSMFEGMFVSPAYTSVTNTTTATLGPSTLTMTNYRANTLPETISSCTAGVFTLTEFALQTGTVQGTTYPLMTLFHVKESQVSSGQLSFLDITIRILSITKA